MLYLNKRANCNPKKNNNNKTHFKAYVYISYEMYNFTIQCDSYNTHNVSYDSWALLIHPYYTKLHMIPIAYHTILTTMPRGTLMNRNTKMLV